MSEIVFGRNEADFGETQCSELRKMPAMMSGELLKQHLTKDRSVFSKWVGLPEEAPMVIFKGKGVKDRW